MASAKEPMLCAEKTGYFYATGEHFYSRDDAIRDGKPMTYMAKGKMRTTKTA